MLQHLAEQHRVRRPRRERQPSAAEFAAHRVRQPGARPGEGVLRPVDADQPVAAQQRGGGGGRGAVAAADVQDRARTRGAGRAQRAGQHAGLAQTPGRARGDGHGRVLVEVTQPGGGGGVAGDAVVDTQVASVVRRWCANSSRRCAPSPSPSSPARPAQRQMQPARRGRGGEGQPARHPGGRREPHGPRPARVLPEVQRVRDASDVAEQRGRRPRRRRPAQRRVSAARQATGAHGAVSSAAPCPSWGRGGP